MALTATERDHMTHQDLDVDTPGLRADLREAVDGDGEGPRLS